MSYYHLPTNLERGPGRLETKLSDGRQLGPPEAGWTNELAALCGFVPVATKPRPDDTSTQTSDRSVVLVAGTPTEQWTVRAKSAAELDNDTHATVSADLEAKARTYLSAAATFLALATPTQAQVLAQVQRNTRAISALVRLDRPDLQVPSTDV